LLWQFAVFIGRLGAGALATPDICLIGDEDLLEIQTLPLERP
jgi:hypothetical protein